MTQEQEKIFTGAAKAGIACGLWHPFEWFQNCNDMLFQGLPFEHVPDAETKLLDAFVAFFRETGSAPGDPVEKWTNNDFLAVVENYYRKRA